MSLHVEPTPLDGPLPGGAGGKPSVVVEPLLAGQLQAPAGHLAHKGGRLARASALGLTSRRANWPRVPIPVYLIRHPTAGAVLVDTGLHPSIAARPAANLGRPLAWYTRARVTTGQDLPTQLRRRDVDPRSIETVVMTHLHIDHSSGIAEFENATFIVTAAEWAAATEPNPTPRGYRPAHLNYLFDYRTVDYGGPGITSYASFGRTFDLFGDGSIRLAYTPGHSPGHQSVICRLRNHDFVIAGDAVFTIEQLRGGQAPGQPADEHNWRRSQRELQRFGERYPDAVIAPGHDAENWETLAPRYE